MSNNRVQEWSPTWMLGFQLSGKVVGILGLGRIGKATAKRVWGFGPAEILYTLRTKPKFDSTEASQPYTQGLRGVPFEELVSRSDVIFICTSLNPSSHHLFNSQTFKAMKKGCILINTSRGGVIDTPALVDALDSHQVGGVALDVTEPEPLPPHHPLVTNYGSRVVLTPHLGSATRETRDAMGFLAIENLEAGVLGQPLPASVL